MNCPAVKISYNTVVVEMSFLLSLQAFWVSKIKNYKINVFIMIINITICLKLIHCN